MKRSSVATDASSDDEQVIVERLGAPVLGKGGGDDLVRARACREEADTVRVGLLESRGTEGFSPEAAKSEIYVFQRE